MCTDRARTRSRRDWAFGDQSPASEERFNGTFLRRHGPQILGINNIAQEDTLLLNSLNQQLNRIANFRKPHPAMPRSFSEGIFAICAESRFRCAVSASGGTRLSQLFKETSTN